MKSSAVTSGFGWTFKHKKLSLMLAGACFALTMFSTRWLGTEFLPELNEGALWVEAKMPMSYSLPKTVDMVSVLRKELQSFPEVMACFQTGRSNDE
ncbi:MAG: efflux RND transporter permease subunit [Crocinitomicaceae bacterium]